MRSLALIALVAWTAAAPRAQADALADLRLASAVRLALATDVRTRALDVDVTARAGRVALDGVSGSARSAALSVAGAVPGVAGVEADGAPLPPAEPRETPTAVERPVERPVAREPEPVREASPADRPVFHTVERGETLFSLARRYETTVEDVMRLNGMRSGEIRVGQRLRMR